MDIAEAEDKNEIGMRELKVRAGKCGDPSSQGKFSNNSNGLE